MAQQFEGWAFTFCKAAALALVFQRYTLLAVSALAMLFYILAAARGAESYRCWAKPPWVTIFWALVFAWQCRVLLWPHPVSYWL